MNIEALQTFVNNFTTTVAPVIQDINNLLIKVNYSDLEKTISEIEGSLQSLEEYISDCFDPILNTDAWSSRYQRAFNKHIEEVTLVYLRKIIADCRSYNTYLTKVISKYKKIDTYR